MFLSRPTDRQSPPSDFSPRKLTIKSGGLEEVCSIQLVLLRRPSISTPSATSHCLNSLFTQGNMMFFLRSVVNFLTWAAHQISWLARRHYMIWHARLVVRLNVLPDSWRLVVLGVCGTGGGLGAEKETTKKAQKKEMTKQKRFMCNRRSRLTYQQ